MLSNKQINECGYARHEILNSLNLFSSLRWGFMRRSEVRTIAVALQTG